ncbi:type II and III secretion system protein [Cyanobacterium aponinum UTEX 3222]|uniref:type II and III secretion system protein n=1 Tax=Cyanobacterium aponinum TaxID=379064 RepID=UPI002B4BFBD7|nr:type II and III secretion system protein [Cyanobacterium aponinum]WRL40227.1 type II and III secretion system protein [Cyanobacterium aponinum UTEX 3221]WRL43129.1 type II and III secretion system protein [Cyanobacterium aponinum UTEX 3222]
MNKFLFNQVKVVSGTTAFILLWQSFAIANPRLNKTLKIKKSPEWIAQLSTQNQDVLVPNPIVEIDGKPVDSTQPTIPAPQFLPRAVAPPVGDMSVSNVRNAIPTINLGTSALIPRLVLRDAPATEVLALLTRAAGLNIIFTDQSGTEGSGATVSLDLENEPIQDVFNSVLLISGLKANRQGNTVFVGNKLPPTVKNTITRSIRLNQYSAIGAASFLNSQGAQGNIVELKEEEQDGRVTQTFEVKPLESEEKDSEYLVLKGLTVHADPIHDTITLVGEPYLVQTATSFLTQLDVRRRQVAVNVKVVDIQLDQVDSFGSSFSFGIDNTGVVQDGGVGVINFGTNNQNVDSESWRTSGQGLGIPGYADNELVDPFNNEIVITEEFSTNLSDSLQDTVERSLANVLDQESASNLTDTLSRNFTDTINRSLSQFGNTTNFTRDQVETLTRNLQQELINTTGRTLSESQLSALTQDVVRDITNNVGRTVTRTLQGIPLGSPNSGQISPFGVNYDATQPGNPASVRPGRNFNVPQAFLAQIRANVTSGNAKILTDPTLVVQEGQVGAVKLVENVVTSVNTSIDQLSGVRTTTPVIEPAGLTLSVVVDKIDDNGFITLQVEPNISAPGTPQVFRSGVGADNVITPLVERTVSSGKIRLRDGQTLILSGIIQDGERTTVSKVPILGDLPIIGSLFRSTVKDKARSEVVVILTPQILDDSEGYSGFGYNYTPSRETGKYLRERGLNIPTTPY